MIVCSCELRHTHDKCTNTTNTDNSPRANMAYKYLPNKPFSYKSTMLSNKHMQISSPYQQKVISSEVIQSSETGISMNYEPNRNAQKKILPSSTILNMTLSSMEK